MEKKKPKNIEEFLTLDLRKVDVILTKSLFKDICKRFRKLEDKTKLLEVRNR